MRGPVYVKARNGKTYGPYYYDDSGNKISGGSNLTQGYSDQTPHKKGWKDYLSDVYTATSLVSGSIRNVSSGISGVNAGIDNAKGLNKNIKDFRRAKKFAKMRREVNKKWAENPPAFRKKMQTVQQPPKTTPFKNVTPRKLKG